MLFALRASDGQVRWKDPGPAAPTLADGTLYAIVVPADAASALTAADGAMRWQVTFPGCFTAVGSDDPPLLAGSLLSTAGSTRCALAMARSSGARPSSGQSCRHGR